MALKPWLITESEQSFLTLRWEPSVKNISNLYGTFIPKFPLNKGGTLES